MLTFQSYYNRAMQSPDRRFARVFEKMGYGAKQEEVKAPEDEKAALRAEYERVMGKRPFMGWDADKLRDKIAAAQAEE
ncbi:MAG TPA: hypothetical protein VK062_05720 [Burkholderiaceae bacterium]|nr:hypothetical protein [Burkholderiaceae bacterium]